MHKKLAYDVQQVEYSAINALKSNNYMQQYVVQREIERKKNLTKPSPHANRYNEIS